MKDGGESIWGSVVTWRLSILRCALYGSMVAWGVFKAGTNGFDSLAQMSPLQKADLGGDMAFAFAGVLLAFLDNSIARLSNTKSDSTEITTQTQTTIKPGP